MSAVREQPRWHRLEVLPTAWGGSRPRGRLRQRPEDFQVDEILGFGPDGAGEHVLLRLRKRGVNTDWVARLLARTAGVALREVGFGGLKDRHAVTTQWFSVRLTKRPEPDWGTLDSERIQVLEVARHRRKLRRGCLRSNRFRIHVRDIEGFPRDLETVLGRIAAGGMPNYFGAQRFGNDYGNLPRAEQLLQGRLERVRPHLRGLYLSALRGQMFNEVLAERVRQDSWGLALPGDPMQLQGSRSRFLVEVPDDTLRGRALDMDIHPTGPLWGTDGMRPQGEAAALETAVLAPFEPWCRGLEEQGLRGDRRALRVRVDALEWSTAGRELTLSFCLPAGSYATALLRELVTSVDESGTGLPQTDVQVTG